jgi:stress response protein YsnF
MQDQDPTQSDQYENVRVINRQAPAEEAAGKQVLPQYLAPPQAHVETEWRVPTNGQQYMPLQNQAVAVAPLPATQAPPAAPPVVTPTQAPPAAPAATSAAPDPTPGTAPAPTSTPTPVEMVSWREDLQVTTAAQERTIGTVRVRKYVTVEDFTGTVPIEYETVQVIREPVSAQEAALLTPADIAESTQEVELHTQEALVVRRMVPTERVRLQVSRVKGEATINDTLRSEHLEVDEPTAPPNLQEAVRRIDAPYDGRSYHNPQAAQQPTLEQPKQQENGKRRFGRRG